MNMSYHIFFKQLSHAQILIHLKYFVVENLSFSE